MLLNFFEMYMSDDEYKEDLKKNLYEMIFLAIETMKISFHDCMLMPIDMLRKMIDWKIDIQNKQIEQMNKNNSKDIIKGKTIHLK